MWAMELSPAGFDAMLTDLSYMDRKTGRAYLQLVGYLRRFGSVPSGERALAGVLNITPRFLRDVAWPLLEDRLVLSEDKRRYSDPDITADRPGRAAPAPAAPEKSKQQQEAAQKRWDAQKERKRQEAEAHAEPMRGASGAHTNSMRDASKTHAETDASASNDASDASPRTAASPPPLKQDSFFQPVGKKESSGGGGTRASAGDDAEPDAAAHARTHQNHAQPHAEEHAPSVRPIRLIAIPIPPDWQPSAECRAEAERLGVNVDLEITKFVLRCLKDDDRSKNWDASFLIWCHRQVEWAKRNPQVEPPMVIPGGKKEPEAAEPEIEEPIVGSEPLDQWARVDRAVRKAIGKQLHNSWMRGVCLGDIDGEEVTIKFTHGFARDHVRKHFELYLLRAWQAEDPKIKRIEMVVEAAPRAASGD